MTGIARYYIVREALRKEIREKFRPGEKLPPEPELIKRFAVSRITIRYALEQLRAEGLITRVQGKGTFVAHPSVRPDFRALRSFVQDIEASGQAPGTKVIRVESVIGPPRPCELLEVPPETTLVLVEKVRLADKEPISFEISYLPQEIAAAWNKDLIKQVPIFDLLRDRLGILISRAKYQVSGASAIPAIAKALRTKKLAPLLRVERVNYDDRNRPIDYDEMFYRADRVTYTFEAVRGNAQIDEAKDSDSRLVLSGISRIVN